MNKIMVGGVKCIYEEYVPEWAVNYLEYGDDPDLSSQDTVLIDEWLEKNKLRGSTFVPDFKDTIDFDRSPAFGLPTNTVYCRFYK